MTTLTPTRAGDRRRRQGAETRCESGAQDGHLDNWVAVAPFRLVLAPIAIQLYSRLNPKRRTQVALGDGPARRSWDRAAPCTCTCIEPASLEQSISDAAYEVLLSALQRELEFEHVRVPPSRTIGLNYFDRLKCMRTRGRTKFRTATITTGDPFRRG